MFYLGCIKYFFSDDMEGLVTLGRFVLFIDNAEGRKAKLNIYHLRAFRII